MADHRRPAVLAGDGGHSGGSTTSARCPAERKDQEEAPEGNAAIPMMPRRQTMIPAIPTPSPVPVGLPPPAPAGAGGAGLPIAGTSTNSPPPTSRPAFNARQRQEEPSSAAPAAAATAALQSGSSDSRRSSSGFHPTAPPCALDRRIASLENRLLEEGIGTSLPPQPRSLPPGVSSPSPPSAPSRVSSIAHGTTSSNNDGDGDDVLKTFLSTIRSMAANVSKTPTQPDPKVRTTKERALTSLVAILELSLDETSRLSTELTAAPTSAAAAQSAAVAEAQSNFEARENEYRTVISGLVDRVQTLGDDVVAKSTTIVEAEKRVVELEGELKVAHDRVRELTEAGAGASVERSSACRDVSTCTGDVMIDDDEGSANESSIMDDHVLEHIREENERLRHADRGNSVEGNVSAAAAASEGAPQTTRTYLHDAIHVELRAQAALLEEENRRLLQNLDMDGSSASGAAASTPFAAATAPFSGGGDIATPSFSPFYDMSGGLQSGNTVQQLRFQNEELQRTVRDRDERLARAEANLRALVEQSRTSSAEASRLAAEGGTAWRRLDEEVKRAEAAERTVNEADRERSDMLRAYRAVVDERSQLATRVDELATERSRLGQELTLRQGEVRSLQSQCNETAHELNRRTREKTECEHRLGEADRDCQALRCSLETSEGRNIALKREIESLRQSSGMASNQAAELQRAIARAQQEVEELRRTISALENEKGLLQSAVAEEKRRVEGMENVVSTTRAKEAAAAEQISKLSRENARLATKLNEADARLETASTSRKSFRPRRKAGEANGVPVLSEVNNATSNGEGVPAAILFSKDAPATSAPGLSDYLPSG